MPTSLDQQASRGKSISPWAKREEELALMADPTGSVSYWISRLQGGHDDAAEAIWRRFHRRLLRVAARILPDAATFAGDEEDVVNGAFHSFFRRVDAGEFPDLEDRSDLWRLLSAMTRRKTINMVRRQHRLKRGGARLDADPCNEAPPPLDQFSSTTRAPDRIAIERESVRRLLGALDKDLREIALCRLNGYSNQEIAAKIRRSVPTVERRLRLIRRKWEAVSG